MSAGMDCANTLNDSTRSMDLDATLEFLEPQFERVNPANPAEKLPARAGAMCTSADYWNTMRTDLEVICRKLGNQCTYEVQEAIKSVGARFTSLQSRAIGKKRGAVK